MELATVVDARGNGIKVVHESCPERNQKDRILEALGSVGHIPRVHEEPLSRYYEYLTKHLYFPFHAHYPKPVTFRRRGRIPLHRVGATPPGETPGRLV